MAEGGGRMAEGGGRRADGRWQMDKAAQPPSAISEAAHSAAANGRSRQQAQPPTGAALRSHLRPVLLPPLLLELAHRFARAIEGVAHLCPLLVVQHRAHVDEHCQLLLEPAAARFVELSCDAQYGRALDLWLFQTPAQWDPHFFSSAL